MPLLRGLFEPACCRHVIALDTEAITIKIGKQTLCDRVALVRRAAQPLSRLTKVLVDAVAETVRRAQLRLRGDVAALRPSLELQHLRRQIRLRGRLVHRRRRQRYHTRQTRAKQREHALSHRISHLRLGTTEVTAQLEGVTSRPIVRPRASCRACASPSLPRRRPRPWRDSIRPGPQWAPRPSLATHRAPGHAPHRRSLGSPRPRRFRRTPLPETSRRRRCIDTMRPKQGRFAPARPHPSSVVLFFVLFCLSFVVLFFFFCF